MAGTGSSRTDDHGAHGASPTSTPAAAPAPAPAEEVAQPPPDEPDLEARIEAARGGLTALAADSKASLAARGVLHPDMMLNVAARDHDLAAVEKAAGEKLKAAREKGDAALKAAASKRAAAAPPPAPAPASASQSAA